MDLETKVKKLENTAGVIINDMKEIIEKVGVKNNDIEEYKLYIENNNCNEEEIEELNKYIDFVEELSENIKESGIKKEYNGLLSEYVYSILANKMSILISGYNSRNFANAISNTIDGKNVAIVNLPLGYNNIVELSNKICKIKNRVILIENVVDNISDSVYLPLLKQNTDKIFIFSIENIKNIALLPDSIFNYMTLIELDKITGFGGKHNYNKYKIEFSILNREIDNSIKDSKYRLISKINCDKEITNIMKIKYSEIISIFESLELDSSIFSLIYFTLSEIIKENESKEKLLEFIKKQEISENEIEILEKTIGVINE